MARELDVRGEICPYPMMRTSEVLKKLAPGETLEVVTDHPPALSTIPWDAARQGFRAEIARAGGAEWRITLTPAAGATHQELVADLGRQLESVGAVGE